jgi:hypothetical protein
VLWLVEVFQFFLHNHVEQVTAVNRNDAQGGAAANRLEGGMQLFIAAGRVSPPRLEDR